MEKITESTLIPISLVGTIIGGIVWLSVIYFKAEAAANDIDKIEQRLEVLQSKIVEQNEKILEKVTRLETRLESK